MDCLARRTIVPPKASPLAKFISLLVAVVVYIPLSIVVFILKLQVYAVSFVVTVLLAMMGLSFKVNLSTVDFIKTFFTSITKCLTGVMSVTLVCMKGVGSHTAECFKPIPLVAWAVFALLCTAMMIWLLYNSNLEFSLELPPLPEFPDFGQYFGSEE